MQPERILITGASTGLGRALALEYAAPDIDLYLCARSQDKLNETAQACEKKGANVQAKALDVSDRAALYGWFDDIKDQGSVDLVIANAGISGGSGANDLEGIEQADKIFAINLGGVLNTVYPAIDIMKNNSKGGQIAVVSSLAGYHGFPGAAAYSASKAAVKSFAESWRVALKDDNIHVSCIAPGFVDTPLTRVNPYKMPFLMRADKAARLIKKRLEAKKSMIAFPWPMRFMAWLLSILPYWISDRLLSNAPSKPTQE